MTDQIKGLLTQKPESPAPEVGRVLHFTTENRTSAKGNAWTKIKNDAQNGAAYRILRANQTDYVDQHGNVSFDMLIEEAGNPIGSNGKPTVDRDESMAYAGTFNAAVALTAAGLKATDAEITRVKNWMEALGPIRRADPKGPWMEAEGPDPANVPVDTAESVQADASADDDIPF